MKLHSKIAVVTGGGGAIGGAISRRFAEDGACVAVTDCVWKQAEAVAKKIRERGGQAVAFVADVLDSGSVQAMVSEVMAEFGRIDILVNNVGGSAALRNSLSEFKDADEIIWQWVLDLNLGGTMRCTRAILPEMVRQCHGKILNISSIAGEVGMECRVDYSAAKAGVIGFTKALAIEAGPHNINVNCISPGLISRCPVEGEPEKSDGTYLGRRGFPSELAAMAVFLVSEEASFITGSNYIVDGGRVLGPTAREKKS